MNHKDQIKAIRAAKDAARALTDTEKALRAQHTEFVAERTRTYGAYAAPEECITHAERLVDEASARWADREARTIAHATGGYKEARVNGPDREVKPYLPPIEFDHHRGLEALCGLVPALIKSRLADTIRAADAPFGLPAEARAVKLAELDRQITELESQHVELVDAAGEVGITLPLLDAVRERREAEARREKRERELAEQRAKGIYEVTL